MVSIPVHSGIIYPMAVQMFQSTADKNTPPSLRCQVLYSLDYEPSGSKSGRQLNLCSLTSVISVKLNSAMIWSWSATYCLDSIKSCGTEMHYEMTVSLCNKDYKVSVSCTYLLPAWSGIPPLLGRIFKAWHGETLRAGSFQTLHTEQGRTVLC